MKTFIITTFFIVSYCLADQRHFVWTYEYKIVNKGEVEIEHYYTTSHTNRSDLSKNIKINHQFELEIGMNKHFDFAIYHQLEQKNDILTYKGYKLRGRYQVGEKNEYLLDPLLYLEYHGKPDFIEHGIEAKLILAKEVGRIIASFNPVIEIEISDGENEIETEYSGGLTYTINELLHAGIELKGSNNGHYFGPTISHGVHDIWFSLGSVFAIGTIKEDRPEIEIRMIIGVGIK